MKDDSQDLRDEQVHIAPDAAQEEQERFSLEDILDEFGGWSKREPEEKPAQEDVAWGESSGNEPEEDAKDADVKEADTRETPAPGEAKPEDAPPQTATQDTVRFTPIRDEDVPPKPEVWRYEGEPLPESAADAQSAEGRGGKSSFAAAASSVSPANRRGRSARQIAVCAVRSARTRCMRPSRTHWRHTAAAPRSGCG